MEGSLVAYKVFTNGSVLQASEINDNLMRQSVMVFSNAAARSAAITVPLEGMLTWLEDTNQYENYNGSAWVQTITPSGYSLIKSQAIGTSVTAVTVTGAFSSTYDVYQIVVSGGVGSTSSALKLQFGSTTANYRWGLVNQIYTSPGTVSGSGSNSANGIDYVGSVTTNKVNAFMTVTDPFGTRVTSATGTYLRTDEGGTVTGLLSDLTSYTAFTLSLLSGSMTGGTVYVYGLRKA
jgi:hypothetical protein